MSTAPAGRPTLGEEAYRRLRDDIVACRLAPGARFTERQLAGDTGFGVSPLRDALTRLDHEGLVRTLPRKGYQVSPLTPKSIDDLFELWQIVGPELARRGVERATPDQLGRLSEGFQAIESLTRSALGTEDALALVRAERETFAVLAEATGNAYLVSSYTRLAGDMARIWALIHASSPGGIPHDPPGYWLEHVLVQRDGEAAARATLAHVTAMREQVLRIVHRWPSVLSTEIRPRGTQGTPDVVDQ